MGRPAPFAVHFALSEPRTEEEMRSSPEGIETLEVFGLVVAPDQEKGNDYLALEIHRKTARVIGEGDATDFRIEYPAEGEIRIAKIIIRGEEAERLRRDLYAEIGPRAFRDGKDREYRVFTNGPHVLDK